MYDCEEMFCSVDVLFHSYRTKHIDSYRSSVAVYRTKHVDSYRTTATEQNNSYRTKPQLQNKTTATEQNNSYRTKPKHVDSYRSCKLPTMRVP